MRSLKVQIDGSCLYNGHGGWGVVLIGNDTQNYHGHILTNHSVTAEKMALAMALVIIPPDRQAVIKTDCRAVYLAFHKPKDNDVFDEEIQLLKANRPLVDLEIAPRKEVNLAHKQARRGSFQK